MAQEIRGRALAIVASVLLWCNFAAAQEIVATPQHANGIYRLGEKIQWQVAVRGSATPITTGHYVVQKNGAAVMAEGNLDLTAGPVTLETQLDEPGTVLVQITAQAGGKQIKQLVGAALAPEKISPSAPPPADFDTFWQAKIAELQTIPPNPVLEPAASGKPGVEYYKIQLDNIHGTHVYGQLARPQRAGKFPALLMVQYAGVYGLPKGNVVSRAQAGWMALNIMAHDLPLDRPEDFYKQLSQTTLKDYVSTGSNDREKSYFLRMFLGCYRAADYLASLPEWDGRTLVVMGTSQGGLQSFVTAGLHPKVSAMLVNVPAGCDTTGPLVGRAVPWPYWYNNAHGDKTIMETSRYFDAVNFAAHVHCSVLVALGLIDQTATPASIFTAYNQLKGPKEVVVMPKSDHHGTNNTQAAGYRRADQWLKALVEGKPVPPQ